ncbi:PD-(D/E)XK nuclease family protein [Chryseolinea lacunae]|uniref:PD-(D/E)XK nuclease family protein n=1 Tax=Chryseolinea lacunae TaxID=2801331 RepID=A0ABS1KKU6_9BACT|nr:PD-(D/E)XK nuclease family protein [Chryseolinea lacunae]MBL0740081.1 PD-(D/E)XK nuclease family protein [Chryseolinea lacunae]
MKPFLYELAETLYKTHRPLDALTVIFPNRRAVLYFRKHLSTFLDRPAFAPRLITIEDFISGLTELKVPDKLELIHRLFKTYNDLLRKNLESEGEPFDKFYFWGDMLLSDFDEVDKYMVNPGQLFQDLSHQKELDSSFDYLTDEQREFLRNFWGGFEENLTENKRKFLEVWNQLFKLYTQFKQTLLAEGFAYEGMLHRTVAETISDATTQRVKGQTLVFAGFNALTKAEEVIISFFVDKGLATVYWDLDEYYVNDTKQEAGKFFREYQQHPVLEKTFQKDIPSNFTGTPASDTGAAQAKSIRIFGAAQPVGQAKAMAQVLREELLKGIDPEDTLIVLPDEKLLLPVLHGLSNDVEKLNITMGFPVSSTPLYNLVELLVEMQIGARHDQFNHRQVLALLGHPYVVAADAAVANAKRKEILGNNWVHVSKNFLASSVALHRLIFKTAEDDIIHYLHDIVMEIGVMPTVTAFDKEYAFHFLKLLNRMQDVMGAEGEPPSAEADDTVITAQPGRTKQKALKSFLRLFRQLIQAYKIPFTGEPLKGLQVMGVLETRNLDYKNVFILSLNEGAFPSSGSKGSYIPYNIRKAYGLPTVEHQDAMYAYLFYRVLQRAENIFLFYNAETDVLGQGEMSRYLQQLLYESGLTLEKKILHNPVQPTPITPITVEKNESVMQMLARLSEGNSMFRGISPSALNTYIECRLRFYFRHVAKIREADAVEEDLDARVLGNFLHDVMEHFYKRLREQKQSKAVEASDFDAAPRIIDQLIDQVFIDSYGLDPTKPVEYEGQRLVVREVVKRFAHRIVEMDKAYAPFVMEGVEQEGMVHKVNIDRAPGYVLLSGKIDRVDRKDDVLRVIDYKTGKDKLDFESVASLFVRDGRRNKAAFQTLVYALLYRSNTPMVGLKIVPGLINRMNLFDEDFKFGLRVGKDYVTDVEPLLPEFEQQLKIMLEELFDIEVPFDQTTDHELCRNCPYQGICYR